MNTFFFVSAAALAVIWLFALLLWLRNDAVASYRSHILNEIYQLNLEDIKAHRDYAWRWKRFADVSYESMAWQFWRPLKNFGLEKLTENTEDKPAPPDSHAS